MLERNRLQPPRPSAPPQSAGCLDGTTPNGCGGLFASAEDYDATGILAGVDPCESRYWWMPELYAAPNGNTTPAHAAHVAAAQTTITTAHGQPSTHDAIHAPELGSGRHGPMERLLRAGHAARRASSRSTAAA